MENLEITNLANFYRGKKVLVTGHTGFKGGWLALWLYKMGAEVAGFSISIPTNPSFFESTHLHRSLNDFRGNISNYEEINNCILNFNPSVVFHLAAQPLVIESYNSPINTIESNITGTACLLEACRNSKSVKSVVIVTSDKCYENNETGMAFSENDRMGGNDLYSASKGCAELIVNAYRHSFFPPALYGIKHSLSIATARSGNIIGGGDWGLYRLFPDCIKSLTENREIVIRNPSSVRPWQFVLDPLFGYLKLGYLLHSEGPRFSGAWNFGPKTDNVRTVSDVVKLIIKYWEKGQFRVEQSTINEAKLLLLNTEKATTELSWFPAYNFETSVLNSINWYKNFYNNADSDHTEYSLLQISDYLQTRHL